LGHNVDPGLGTKGYGAAVEDSHIPGFALVLVYKAMLFAQKQPRPP
jgi:hypothetical protein